MPLFTNNYLIYIFSDEFLKKPHISILISWHKSTNS